MFNECMSLNVLETRLPFSTNFFLDFTAHTGQSSKILRQFLWFVFDFLISHYMQCDECGGVIYISNK